MIPAARLQAVLDLLKDIHETPRPTDALASQYFRARRYIGSKDRAAISTTLYDVLRHHARLEWWLPKTEIDDGRLKLLAYLTLVEKKTSDEITELFNGKKFAPILLTKDEKTFLQKLQGHTIEHSSMSEAVKAECPDWAFVSLKKRFGDRFMKEMQALLEPASLDIRVNILKATRDEILTELKKSDIEASACAFSPWGVRIKNRPALTALPMLKDGRIDIQDEGSQLIAWMTDAMPGQRVVDFCAGAGGKALAIAAQMKNKGRITVCDVMERRLKQSTERFRRAGVHNVDMKPLKNESDPWVKRHKGMFDRVLVDAPCSGSGAWRRAPDSRWRSLGPDLTKLLPLQASILASAARLVKPGGRLIYATCSLLAEENENQVEGFLATHPQFQIMDCRQIILSEVEKKPSVELPFSGCYLSLTPAQHKTDGFFGAVLEHKV